MGNNSSSSSHRSTHSKNISNSLSLKIRLLVIGYIRLYIKQNNMATIYIPLLVETVCSKYYGEALINCIFQCKIDRYGYLMSINQHNKYNEKSHRDKIRNEQIKLIAWQQYLYNNHSISPSITSEPTTTTTNQQKISWNKILKNNKFINLVNGGIPSSFRPLIWKKFVDIQSIRKIATDNYGQRTLFQDMVNSQQSPFHEEIWKDINKINKNHTRFGLYSYSKEINSLTKNNDDLYQNVDIDHHEYNINMIKKRRRRNNKQNMRRTRSARRLSRSARNATKSNTGKHQLRSSSNSDILKLKEKYELNKGGSIRRFSASVYGHHPNKHMHKLRKPSKTKSIGGLLPLTSESRASSYNDITLKNGKIHSRSHSSPSKQQYKQYSVTYFKHKVIDANTINRHGTHNVNIDELERNATKTQLQLYNILKAFSLYQRSIGYTSNCGLCVVAGLLLLYMSEEEVFWFLNGLCDENDKFKMLNLWKPTVPDMGLRLFQMQSLITKYLPKISNHFHSKRIVSASMFYAQNWFKTLFAKTEISMISHDALFRIWDCYFNEGFIILFKFGLGVLKYNEQKLLKSVDIDDIIEILRDDTKQLNVDQFVKMSLSFKIDQKYLDKLKSKFYSK